MKIPTLFTLLCCLFLFVQCKEKEPVNLSPKSDPPPYSELCQNKGTTAHVFEGIVPDGEMFDKKLKVTVTLPVCYELRDVIGIDDIYGKFVIPELNVILSFGMGQPAGTYGLDVSPTKTEEIINSRKFWYEEKNGNLYASFPSAGPASFVTTNVEYKEEILTYLRGLKSRIQ